MAGLATHGGPAIAAAAATPPRSVPHAAASAPAAPTATTPKPGAPATVVGGPANDSQIVVKDGDAVRAGRYYLVYVTCQQGIADPEKIEQRLLSDNLMLSSHVIWLSTPDNPDISTSYPPAHMLNVFLFKQVNGQYLNERIQCAINEDEYPLF
jgi:hypothetical protein